jgi:hypothetical protein
MIPPPPEMNMPKKEREREQYLQPAHLCLQLLWQVGNVDYFWQTAPQIASGGNA